jgi:hypothetical protein
MRFACRNEVVHIAEHEREAFVALVPFEVGAAAADREAIEHGDAAPGLGQERVHQMGADESGAAGDEDAFGGHEGCVLRTAEP